MVIPQGQPNTDAVVTPKTKMAGNKQMAHEKTKNFEGDRCAASSLIRLYDPVMYAYFTKQLNARIANARLCAENVMGIVDQPQAPA